MVIHRVSDRHGAVHQHAVFYALCVGVIHRHLGHVVLVVRTVEHNVQFDVTHIHSVSLQLELHALVHHLCIIGGDGGVTHRRRNSTRENHVIRQFVEIVELSVQILADAELKTKVHYVGTLPSDGVVSVAAFHVCLAVVLVFNAIHIGVRVERVDLVTEHTPAQTQLTVLEPVFGIAVLDEVLVGESPRRTDRTEMTPAVTFGVTGATVRTVVGGDGVTLFVRVHCRSEIGIHRITCAVAFRGVHLHSVAQLDTAAVGEVGLIAILRVGEVQIVLMTRHHTDGVVSERAVILQQLLCGDGEHIAALLQDTTDTFRIAVVRVGELRMPVVIEVQTGVDHEFQTFVEFELQRRLGIHLVLLLVLLVQAE